MRGTVILVLTSVLIASASIAQTSYVDSAIHPKPYLLNSIAFGATVGTPGGINLIVEKYIDRVALRAEAGALPNVLYGYQGAVSYVIKRSDKSLMEISLLAGRSRYDLFSQGWYTSLGCGIAINAGGFYFETSVGKQFQAQEKSVTVGSQFFGPTPTSIPLTFQIGYVH